MSSDCPSPVEYDGGHLNRDHHLVSIHGSRYTHTPGVGCGTFQSAGILSEVATTHDIRYVYIQPGISSILNRCSRRGSGAWSGQLCCCGDSWDKVKSNRFPYSHAVANVIK